MILIHIITVIVHAGSQTLLACSVRELNAIEGSVD